MQRLLCFQHLEYAGTRFDNVFKKVTYHSPRFYSFSLQCTKCVFIDTHILITVFAITLLAPPKTSVFKYMSFKSSLRVRLEKIALLNCPKHSCHCTELLLYCNIFHSSYGSGRHRVSASAKSCDVIVCDAAQDGWWNGIDHCGVKNVCAIFWDRPVKSL